MGKFKVTGIEEEKEHESFNGKDAIKEDKKSGLKEVDCKCYKQPCSFTIFFVNSITS